MYCASLTICIYVYPFMQYCIFIYVDLHVVGHTLQLVICVSRFVLTGQCHAVLMWIWSLLFIARRAYRQATTSKNIRVFASDGGRLREHSSHREPRKQEQRK